jgi:hypothetical protein
MFTVFSVEWAVVHISLNCTQTKKNGDGNYYVRIGIQIVGNYHVGK